MYTIIIIATVVHVIPHTVKARTMKTICCFAACTMLLVALVTESWCALSAPVLSNMRNKHSRLPRQPTRPECRAFQISLIAGLQFASEECRSSILSVASLLLEFRNVTTSEQVAAAACIPACQSFYNLQVSCIGQEEADNLTSFYCGRNPRGQTCYEAFQSNNGVRVSSACSNNTCTAACATELQTLIADVGCCVRSFPYTFLMADSLSNTCGITLPDFCPHPFNSAITTTAAYTSLFTTVIATFMLLY